MKSEDIESRRIITEDGLFYGNFKESKFNLFLMPDSEYYSEELVRIRDTYGIVIGEQQPDSDGQTYESLIGVYIEDYPRYIRDKDAKYIRIYTSEEILNHHNKKATRLR